MATHHDVDNRTTSAGVVGGASMWLQITTGENFFKKYVSGEEAIRHVTNVLMTSM